MSMTRLIARLDVKGSNLVKGVHLEGLRKLGDPNQFARQYYEQGIDEILYVDIVASLYERNNLIDITRRTTQDVFVPITVGGGVRSVADVVTVLRAGADKVAINTAAIKRPALISEVSQTFGSQCMVLSVHAKRNATGRWEAYYDNGREHTGRDVLEWIEQAVSLGAGEILLTSVDREGTAKGFDIELVRAVSQKVTVPVIACGGMGTYAHLEQVIREGGVEAVAMAHVLHYGKLAIGEIRRRGLADGLKLRNCPTLQDSALAARAA